jgi:hypothetical protein
MVSLLSLNAFDLALTEKLLAGSLFGTANPQLRLPYFWTWIVVGASTGTNLSPAHTDSMMISTSFTSHGCDNVRLIYGWHDGSEGPGHSATREPGPQSIQT